MKTAKRKSLTSRPSMNERGFSLIEVIIALTILTIGVLAVNAMQTVSIRGNKTANDITEATNWSADQVERILRMDYDDLDDTNGNGVGPDLNDNNIDDDEVTLGETGVGDGILNFGLDETVNPDAVVPNDPDGDFTIVYNVAEDYPMEDIKTIHVITTWNSQGATKSVTIRYQISANL